MFFETPIFDNENIFHQPFIFSTIQEYQLKDLPLRQRVEAKPTKFKKLNIENATIIVRIENNGDISNSNELTDQSAINNNNKKNNTDCRAVENNSNCRAVEELGQRVAESNERIINDKRRRPISQPKDQRAVETSDQRAVNDANKTNINKEKINIEKPYSIKWRIALPNNMLTNLVRWHHELTMHTEGAD